MANTAANVSVGKPLASGGVYVAPLGTALPTDCRTKLNAAFVGLGYVSEDGLTNAVETDTEEIKEWGGDTVLTVRTSRTESFTFTLIETNEDVMKLVYGADNVSKAANGDLAVLHNSKDLPVQELVFEIALTGDRVKRMVVPAGKVTEVGEVSYQAGEAIGYEVTVSCAPDTAGNTVYEYIGALAAPTSGS